MRARLLVALAVVALGAGVRPVLAQAVAGQPVARVDVAVFTGSFGADTEDVVLLQPEPFYDRWVHMAVFEASAGYYWTDHLKTEVEALWTSSGETYGSGVITLPGMASGWVHHTNRFAARQFGVGQLWQFGRNAMFHPWVGAGVDVVRIEHTLDRPAQFLYIAGPSGQPSQSIPIPAVATQSVTTRALPFASAGFKAYFNERGFVRTDLNLHVNGGVRQAVWKVGVGVDF